MLVDLACLLLQFIGQEVDQVLHQVTLSHQEVLPDVDAVSFELKFLEEDVQELSVGLDVGLFDPLLQLVDVEVVLLSLKWRLN